MSDFYKLVGTEVVPIEDDGLGNALLEWAKQLEKGTHVAKDWVNGHFVSTVFLGRALGFFSDKPLVFETMVFSDDCEAWQDRCATYEEAQNMHQRGMEYAAAMNPTE